MRTRGQDPTLPEMRRVRLLEMADAMDSSASSSLSFSRSVNVWLLIKRAMLRAVFSCLVTDASV